MQIIQNAIDEGAVYSMSMSMHCIAITLLPCMHKLKVIGLSICCCYVIVPKNHYNHRVSGLYK